MEEPSLSYIRGVKESVQKSMYGLEPVIDLMLAALATDGHVLLEGNPGLGKTALVRCLTQALGFDVKTRMRRIQFTPDLMPSDITGTLMPKKDKPIELDFEPGPIFSWLLLADEINRASPKTQAAMLEAMAERQVTAFGTTYPITKSVQLSSQPGRRAATTPFMVMATQNPIEQSGTFELPEAQADRFMLKLEIPFPVPDVLARILDKETASKTLPAAGEDGAVLDENTALIHLDDLRTKVRALDVPDLVRDHAINMIQASNGRFDQLRDVEGRARVELERLVEGCVHYPLGPRAGFAMLLGAKALALIAPFDMQRMPGDPEEVMEAFSRVVLPAIRHRLQLRHGWQHAYRKTGGRSGDEATDRPAARNELLADFAQLCAPGQSQTSYPQAFKSGLANYRRNPV